MSAMTIVTANIIRISLELRTSENLFGSVKNLIIATPPDRDQRNLMNLQLAESGWEAELSVIPLNG